MNDCASRKTSGRILSLALLGGMTLGIGLGPTDAPSPSPLASRGTALSSPSAGMRALAACDRFTSLPLLLLPDGSALAAGCATAPAPAGAAHALLLGMVALNHRLAHAAPSSALIVATHIPPPPVPRMAPAAVLRAAVLRAAVLRAAPATAPSFSGSAPAGAGSWVPVAGHPSYALGDFAGDPYGSVYGTCTWYAWERRRDEPLLRLGNAAQWAYTAGAHGLHTGTVPIVGATAVFQPGVEGAGGGGHVGHVEAVLAGGWFIISEMNFNWNGGGWGRVDYRYAHAGPGVSFIY